MKIKCENKNCVDNRNGSCQNEEITVDILGYCLSSNMQGSCKKCKYLKEYKRFNPNCEERWEYSYACIVFANEEDGFCLEINDVDEETCEKFTRKGR